MTILAFLIPFLLLGGAVVFIAFSGGPGKAREAYLTRAERGFRVGVFVAFIAFGVAVPALVLANRGVKEGGVGSTRSTDLSADAANGKQLFRERCASCHSLAAVNARGVTGPNLDNIGTVNTQRVLSAIKIGGTGDKRMPANLVTGPDAQDVASYVSSVAGR